MFLNLHLICPGHLGKHYDEVNITLLDHGPEVVDGVGHGPLGGDVEPLTLSHRGRYVAGIDIAKFVVFVTDFLNFLSSTLPSAPFPPIPSLTIAPTAIICLKAASDNPLSAASIMMTHLSSSIA